MRGPLVYCFEEVEDKEYLTATDEVYLHPRSLNAQFRKELLNGVAIIQGKAALNHGNREITITAVPPIWMVAANKADESLVAIWRTINEDRK